MATAAPIVDDAVIALSGVFAIPLRDIAPWAVLDRLLSLIFSDFLTTERRVAAPSVHDGRHLLDFPCR